MSSQESQTQQQPNPEMSSNSQQQEQRSMPPIRPTSESYTTLWSDAHWIDIETIEKINAEAKLEKEKK